MRLLGILALALLLPMSGWAQQVSSISFGSTGLTPSASTWGGVQVGGTLLPTSGGTGVAAYTKGDTLFASATNTLSALPIGTTGQVLTVSGGVPAWSAAASGTVTSVSVVSANGFAGTVATATTTPAITLSTSINAPLLAGNGTAITAAGPVANASLANPATTVNGQTCTLGATCVALAQTLYATGAGSDNAFTCAPSPAWASYALGNSLLCQINNNQTSTTPTINVNALGNKTIVKRASTAVASGDMVSGAIYLFVYNGTAMQVLNPTVP